MVFAPFSARRAKVRLGAAALSNTNTAALGVVVTANKWKITPKTTPADITNFEGAQGTDGFGYTDKMGTLTDASIDITDAKLDANAPLYDALSPGLYLKPSGSLGIQLYLWDTTSPYWYFPTTLVVTTPVEADVTKLMGWSTTLENKGQFYYPTGIVTVATNT